MARSVFLFGTVSLIVLSYNNVMGLAPEQARDALYIPANLAFLGTLGALVVRWAGLTWEHLGLGRTSIGKSALAGLAIGLLVPAPVFLMVAFPALVDEDAAHSRVAQGLGELLYQTVLRIPLGTALFEEMLFRGLLYGLLLKFHGTRPALLYSSAIFGLWHIMPTYSLLRGVEMFTSSMLLGLAMAGSLLAIFAGGLLFALLRHKTGHVAGCVLAHALINSLSALALYFRG